MEIVWLFGEARSRQRRRRRRVAWGAAVLLGCVVALRIAVGGVAGSAPRWTPPPGSGRAASIPTVRAASVLARAPYLGVRCPLANSITCDRVGLAIWLRRPAVFVRGTIAGQPLVLDWFGDEHRVGRVPRRALDGYLQPAHIVTRLGVQPSPSGHWYGSVTRPWPAPLVRLTITFAGGQRVVTQLHVPLETGWG